MADGPCSCSASAVTNVSTLVWLARFHGAAGLVLITQFHPRRHDCRSPPHIYFVHSDGRFGGTVVEDNFIDNLTTHSWAFSHGGEYRWDLV